MLYKTKQYLAPFIKFLIVAACVYYLFKQWHDRPINVASLRNLWQSLSWYVIPSMLVLSLVSWLVESKKWQVLVGGLYRLRFRESVLQNLTAQAASFITPLRAGEVAFKVLFYEAPLRKDFAGRVVLGTMTQMGITLLLGAAGVLLLFTTDLDAAYLVAASLLLFALAVIVACWCWKKMKLQVLSFSCVSLVCGLSLLRYIFFASNWVLVLTALNYPMHLLTCVLSVVVMYLVLSIVPVIPVADIPVRLTTAAMVFEHTAMVTDPLLVATTLVWLVNTLFPTFIGCLLMPFTRLKTSSS